MMLNRLCELFYDNVYKYVQITKVDKLFLNSVEHSFNFFKNQLEALGAYVLYFYMDTNNAF